MSNVFKKLKLLISFNVLLSEKLQKIHVAKFTEQIYNWVWKKPEIYKQYIVLYLF